MVMAPKMSMCKSLICKILRFAKLALKHYCMRMRPQVVVDLATKHLTPCQTSGLVSLFRVSQEQITGKQSQKGKLKTTGD